jgi:hypothetical protein
MFTIEVSGIGALAAFVKSAKLDQVGGMKQHV